MKKDFNTRYKKTEYEIVLDHLDVGGRRKPVANLPIIFRGATSSIVKQRSSSLTSFLVSKHL